MKSTETIVKTISLLFIFSCFVVTLNASNEYSHYSDINSSIRKVLPNSNNNLKHTPLSTTDSFKRDYQIDSLMQNKDSKKIIKSNNFNEKSIEKPSKIEDKIINFEPVKTPCSNSQSDFIEKEWMNKHNFLIL